LRMTASAAMHLLRVTAIIAIALNAVPAAAQTLAGGAPLVSERAPAEVRSLDDGRIIVLYRDAFRGYAPAAASAVEVRDTDGAVAWTRRPGLDVKDATIITVLDAAISAQGQVVVSMVAARPGAGTAHLLAYYSLGPAQTIRLSVVPHACFRISPAADKGVWCLGPEVKKHNSRRSDFRILHHYSEDGVLLASIGERTAFAGARPWDGRARIRAREHDVMLWMPNRRQLVTIDISGTIVSAVPVAEPTIADPRTDYIVSSDGTLLSLAITDRPDPQLASWRRGLFVYDADAAAWQATTINGLSLAVRLVGSAGDVVTLWDREQQRLLNARR
jgi:hypothetical protein